MSLKSIVVFIGPPGSGKGSVSRLCAQQLNWKQVSTGDLCRRHIQEKTSIGKEIDFAIKSGKLVSDRLITEMVCDWFKGHEENTPIILDGYPRTVEQASLLNEFLGSASQSLKITVVRFLVPDSAVVERLRMRYVCKNKDCQAVYSMRPGSSQAPQKPHVCDVCESELGRRQDDNIEAVYERLKVYHTHEESLLEFYKRMGQSIPEVDGDQPIEQVFAEIKQVMEGIVV